MSSSGHQGQGPSGLGPSPPSIDMSKEDELRSKITRIPGCKFMRTGCHPEPKISVSGHLVNQDTINQVMSVLREVKGEPSGWVDGKSLSIFGTKLTHLDLTPLLQARFDFLSISRNDLLTSIGGPPCMEKLENNHQICAKSVHISFNPLITDEGFGDTLKYFDPLSLTSLNLWGMKLEGGSKDKTTQEFLPGLSALKELTSLELAMNKIWCVGGEPFRHNDKLTFLNLSKNDIRAIFKNAFLFNGKIADDDPSHQFRGQNHNHHHHETLVIRLAQCQLTSEAFVDSKMEWSNNNQHQQPAIHLQLMDNRLDSVAQNIFEHFLAFHPKNELILTDNPGLVDDDRGKKWLQDTQKKFNGRLEVAGFNKILMNNN